MGSTARLPPRDLIPFFSRPQPSETCQGCGRGGAVSAGAAVVAEKVACSLRRCFRSAIRAVIMTADGQ